MSAFREHKIASLPGEIENPPIKDIDFKGRKDAKCARFFSEDQQYKVEFSYYVGADWIPGSEGKHFLHVQSKLNSAFDAKGVEQSDESHLVRIDVIKMLYDALSHNETLNHTHDLFEIKWEAPNISLPRSEDILSPLLIVQYLMLVRDIVRKGLKKGYRKLDNNLNGKVKGKVLVSKTIKDNLLKNRSLQTWCTFEVFGTDITENQLLKKALTFSKAYLNGYSSHTSSQFQELFHFVQPAFQNVSEEVNPHEIKHLRFNSFYKEYQQATFLARLILKRFGYNIQTTQQKDTIDTPPHWIDMSKLFELYVLKLLKQKIGSSVEYHPRTYGNELDYLLIEKEKSVVIDAKYKSSYTKHIDHKDIRQVSGYARLTKIMEDVGLGDRLDNPPVLSCLIIYPDQSITGEEGQLPLDLLSVPIKGYVKMYKLGVKLPVQKK